MPITIRKRVRKELKTFTVYTEAEAREKGIEFVPWREVEAGQYCISDDGYVAECIRRLGPYRDTNRTRVRYEIILPYGRRFTGARQLLFEELSKPTHWADAELRRNRGRNTVKLYAQLWLQRKGKLTDDDYHTLGLTYRKDQQIPAASVKRFLKTKQAQAMIQAEIAALLAEQGVTPEGVVKEYKEILEAAKLDGKVAAAKSVVDVFRDMLEMMPKPQQKQFGEEIEVDWDRVLEGEAEPALLGPSTEGGLEG